MQLEFRGQVSRDAFRTAVVICDQNGEVVKELIWAGRVVCALCIDEIWEHEDTLMS